MEYKYHKINKKGYGLTEAQISILKKIEHIKDDEINIELIDKIESVFTRFNFQIGHIGAARKIVKFHPLDALCYPDDNGKYCLFFAGDTLSEALIKTIRAIPNLFSFCSNPKYCFKVSFSSGS